MDYAVIDLGSNTIRLCVFNFENGTITTLLRQKEVVGLADYIENNKISDGGLAKACEVLNDLKAMAERFVDSGKIYVFATASLRGLCNENEAKKHIIENTGLVPDVISGTEEARLDFIGASYAADCNEGVLIDIGGASTELVLFREGTPQKLTSLKMGCLSLYSKYVSSGFPAQKELKAIKQEVRSQLASVEWIENQEFSLMIGVGGTVRAAQKLSNILFENSDQKQILKASNVCKILRSLKNNKDDILHTVYRAAPERVLTITPGLVILREAIRCFKCDEIHVSRFGVREGYFLEHILSEEV